ncbi:Secreted protein OS=Streptomyces alboniger OX=132473 GN=CP975_06425 PE=4 SV=1 [Streptomyces alboniger]
MVATLVDPKDRLNATDFAVRDGAVTATLLGYSSLDVPRCCPDRKDAAKWQWKDGAFERSTPAGARDV